MHNPIDVSKYARNEDVREEMRKAHNVVGDVKIILAAGRFVDWKGFDVLIKGYDIYLSEHEGDAETSVLWIIGDGEEKSVKLYCDPCGCGVYVIKLSDGKRYMLALNDYMLALLNTIGDEERDVVSG